ncbi:DNA mismatch repair protein MutT [Roseivirga seohaensis]|uniref:DNA mismatch repair protein MutT n=1 Tax=Roseivirga seohaensis TaxID=1914963 RepID=A0A150XMD7_9BACT|nr:metallophosphoesterase [Roseivirga seohaensis]KYG79802.1 DNA mismatch repair protein MutT [Roseivirga seohaensis]
MKFSVFSFILIILFLAWIEIYAYQATKTLLKNVKANRAKWLKRIYLLQAVAMMALVFYLFLSQAGTVPFSFIISIIFMSYTAKLIGLVFVFIDDIRRAIALFFAGKKRRKEKKIAAGKKISRSEFLAKTAVAAATLPIVTMSFGIVSGAYDYRIRRRKLYLPNLPSGFNGIKMAQLSDIHSGSFFDKKAVEGGVNLLMVEKPDVVFFTGDLVNNQTKELNEYFDIFSKVKADLGVYSTLGNHDYGDYMQWTSAQAKQKNLQDMILAHEKMGWNLMMNENKSLKVGGDQISLIGVENWGAGRFAKYGDLDLAHKNSEGDVKILLSHDPSHWDAQVRPKYNDIDLMFAGHTHGMQLGVEVGNFRWSPSQWMYPQWADLYTEGNHHLYVNRGFGFLGFPGRIGILPEITIFELTNRPV